LNKHRRKISTERSHLYEDLPGVSEDINNKQLNMTAFPQFMTEKAMWVVKFKSLAKRVESEVWTWKLKRN